MCKNNNFGERGERVRVSEKRREKEEQGAFRGGAGGGLKIAVALKFLIL